MKLIPHKDIVSVEYVVNKWWGDFASIKLKNGETRRLHTAPFTLADKKERLVPDEPIHLQHHPLYIPDRLRI